MSATGSVMTMCAPPSPRRLGDAGDLPGVRQLSETNATQHEPAEHRPLPPAPLAARVGAHTDLLAPPLLVQQCFLRHRLVLVPYSLADTAAMPAKGNPSARSSARPSSSSRAVVTIVMSIPRTA